MFKLSAVFDSDSVMLSELYIQNNFRNDIGLSDIAADADVTPSYMSSIFSKECGVNFKEYLNTFCSK